MSRIAIGVLLFTILAACGREAESREDLEGQPVPDVAAEPALAAPPVSAPPARQPTAADPVRAIPAGTLLTFEVQEDVSTSSHVAGDGFSLVLVDAVTGAAGASLTAGIPAQGIVTEARSSTGADDPALLAVRVASVEAGGSQQPIEGMVQSTTIDGSAQDSGSRTAATIATGAAAGAIIGQILGQDTRSTVAGAAVGTAVGVGVALTTRGGDATLPQGSRMVLRLDRDLVF